MRQATSCLPRPSAPPPFDCMRSGTPRDLDVLIIGGGPAGSACAIRLARGGARVGIIEATDFSRFRIGETIEPSTRRLLVRLGINADDQCDWSAPSAGVAAAWGRPTATQRSSLFNPYGHGWRVDRHAFDRMLFDQARRAGAMALTQCRLMSAARRSSSWTFTLDSGNGPVRGRATWIVAATGRSGCGPLAPARSRLYLDRLVGLALIEEAGGDSRSRDPMATLVEAACCGWWYSVRLPDGRMLAVFFTDSDLLPKGRQDRGRFLHDQLEGSPLTRTRCECFQRGIESHRWSGFDARSSIRQVVMSDGWVAIGDAAMAFDPLCGRGITEALAAGVEAADWFLQSCPAGEAGLPLWIGRVAQRFNDYCAQRLAVYGRETRWAGSLFWQRRRPAPVLAASRPRGVSRRSSVRAGTHRLSIDRERERAYVVHPECSDTS